MHWGVSDGTAVLYALRECSGLVSSLRTDEERRPLPSHFHKSLLFTNADFRMYEGSFKVNQSFLNLRVPTGRILINC